jgi:cytochrome c oxidase cbb3-type subunit 3
MTQNQSQDSSSHNTGGVGTTGHSWDGIEELNNPLPRWWLWTFYATIVWALAYMVVYPALPLIQQATPGLFGYASRYALEADIKRFEVANAPLDSALVAGEITAIKDNPELHHYAIAGGSAVFRTFCAQCHGSGAAGALGYANLIDDEWLWGGSLPDIYHTIRHGVRAVDDPDTRFSEMPAFGDILEAADIADATHYVMALSGGVYNPALVNSGKRIFAENCADCHGETGRGNRDFGAPDLTDAIWLYGSSQKEVYETINSGRQGMMPAWQNRLNEAQLRQVALYVHQLGGGE